MSWVAQVLHVMRKDGRESRWLIAGYAAIVTLSTANALQLPGVPAALRGNPILFVLGWGIFVVAALVQADSPTRADAFWASRPFHPSAMLAAKLSLAAIFVAGLPLLGQFAALSRFDLATGTITQLVGKSAFIYTTVLILSMVAGAVTGDPATFVVTIIAILLFETIGAAAFFWIPAISPPMRIALATLSIAGGVALLAVLYRTRNVRRRTWVAVLCVVTAVFRASFGEVSRPTTIATPPASPRDFGVKPDVALNIESVDLQTIADSAQLRFRIRLEAPPATERLSFDPERVLMHLRNGTTLGAAIDNRSFPYARVTRPGILFSLGLPTGGIQWPARTGFHGPFTVELAATLTNDNRRAIRDGGGVTGVVVEGTVIAMAPRFIATLPLTTGASFASDGARVEVDKVTRKSNDAVVALRIASIRMDLRVARPTRFDDGTVAFALLNASRGEARLLRNGGGTLTAGVDLVLPGIYLDIDNSQFFTQSDNKVDERVDDAWMRGATLIVIDWTLRSRSSVRAEASMP